MLGTSQPRRSVVLTDSIMAASSRSLDAGKAVELQDRSFGADSAVPAVGDWFHVKF